MYFSEVKFVSYLVIKGHIHWSRPHIGLHKVHFLRVIDSLSHLTALNKVFVIIACAWRMVVKKDCVSGAIVTSPDIQIKAR